MIKQICELNDPALDIYTSMSEARLLHYFEPNGGLFIAESPEVIFLALKNGYKPYSLLVPQEDIDSLKKDIMAKCDKVPVFSANKDVISKIPGFHMIRGAMCAMHRPHLPTPSQLLKQSKRVVVLENVENPTNVGAIIRSAAALDIDAILLTHGCADPLYRRAARVSMGTVFQIPWTILQKGTNSPALLHEYGFTTVAMALDDKSLQITDPVLKQKEKLAIFLGSEGYGLKNSTIADCTYTVKIPMSHGVDSLNVAAASAVAFWELTKKE